MRRRGKGAGLLNVVEGDEACEGEPAEQTTAKDAEARFVRAYIYSWRRAPTRGRPLPFDAGDVVHGVLRCVHHRRPRRLEGRGGRALQVARKRTHTNTIAPRCTRPGPSRFLEI